MNAVADKFDDLNGDLKAIAEVIGRQQALYLVSQCPRYKVEGRQGKGQVLLYVPKPRLLDAGHHLCEIIGREDAEKICATFGGELLMLSHCRSIILKHRNDGIVAMAKQGFSIDDLSVFFGLSTRTIAEAVKAAGFAFSQQFSELQYTFDF